MKELNLHGDDMPEKIKIPFYAKKSAAQGLREREINKAGLTKSKAQKLGVFSGIERAKQIIRNKYLKEEDLKAIARFYLRFRRCKTKKCETAIKLWGGRRLGRLMAKIFYGNR